MMWQPMKNLPLRLAAGTLLLLSACQESPPPPPAFSLGRATITYPPGFVVEDSAEFERIMHGPLPDSLPRPKNAPPRPPDSLFLNKRNTQPN